MNNKLQQLYVHTEGQGYKQETDVCVIKIFQIHNNTNVALRMKQWASRGICRRERKIQRSTLNIYILISPPTDQRSQIHQLNILEPFGLQMHLFYYYLVGQVDYVKSYMPSWMVAISVYCCLVFTKISAICWMGSTWRTTQWIWAPLPKKKKLHGRSSIEKHLATDIMVDLMTGEGGAKWNMGYMDKLPGLNWRWIQHLILLSKVFTRVMLERRSKQDSELEDKTQSRKQLHIII